MILRLTVSFAIALLQLLSIVPQASASANNEIRHLTVYDAGLAEVLEVRTVEMQPGLNTVVWRSLMPKAFIRTVRVVAEGAEVVRQEITYDGEEVRNEKSPVLHLTLLNRGAAGPKRVTVDYLAPNLNWENDYALVLDESASGTPPRSAALDAWVSLFNSTGTDVKADTVDLIAGDISLLVGGSGRGMLDLAPAQVSQNVTRFEGFAETAAGGGRLPSSGLSAFHRYTLGRSIAVNANTPISRHPLFQNSRLAIEQRNVFENEHNTQTVGRGNFTLLPRGLEVRLVSRNTTGTPMPAGQVTIYGRTGDLVQIVGQDLVGYTPVDTDFSVSQGRSTTLLGTRRILERREETYQASLSRTRERLITKVEVVLTNRSTLPAEAYVREGIERYSDNEWSILESSVPAEKLGANTVQFKVEVPAGGKTTVSYTVEIR